MDERSNTSHQKRDSDTMQHGELRSDRGSWLVSEFFLRFSFLNFNDTFKTGEALFHIFLSPTRTFVSDSETREREDLSGTDSHPVLASSSHVERMERGDPLLTKTTKNPKPTKNENHDLERGDPMCADIPVWLQ